jgi:hypothetical protein
MCLALGSQQLSGFADHLLKQRHAESTPQALAIGVCHPLLLRLPQNNDGVRQRWDALARESVQLLESTGDGRGSEGRRIDAPAVREHTHRAIAQHAFVEPGD